MKRLFLLLTVFIAWSQSAIAQTPTYMIDVLPHVCSNVTITLLAEDAGTCTIIGKTVPMTFSPGSSTNLAPYPPSIWAIDPAVTCPTCTWNFIAAKVETVCPGTPSGTPTCSNWDSFWIGMPTCGYVQDDCFDYSTSCGTCSAGDIRHGHFDIANMFVD